MGKKKTQKTKQNKKISDYQMLFSKPKKEHFLASPLNQLACYVLQTMQKPWFPFLYLSVIYLHILHLREIRISPRNSVLTVELLKTVHQSSLDFPC